MAIQVTVPPAVEPLSLAEVKLHLRVTNSREDSSITRAALAARRYIEQMTGPLVTQTIRETFAGFPPSTLCLSYPEVRTVTTVAYMDAQGTAHTVPLSDYLLTYRGPGTPAQLNPIASARWPVGALQPGLPVAVDYVAGFGGAADVPEEIKAAILLLVGHLYENREDELRGNNAIPSRLQAGVFALISHYRMH